MSLLALTRRYRSEYRYNGNSLVTLDLEIHKRVGIKAAQGIISAIRQEEINKIYNYLHKIMYS